MIFLYLLVLVIVISAAWAGYSAAPWVPTKPAQRQLVVDNLHLPFAAPSISPIPGEGLRIIDLGCGDGSWLFTFARQYPAIEGIGYDISLLPLIIGHLRKLLSPKLYSRVHLRLGNLWTADISEADLVLVFLMKKAYPRLITKLASLKPSALIAVEAWPLPNIEPHQTITGPNLLPVYIYRGEQFQQPEVL